MEIKYFSESPDTKKNKAQIFWNAGQVASTETISTPPQPIPHPRIFGVDSTFVGQTNPFIQSSYVTWTVSIHVHNLFEKR